MKSILGRFVKHAFKKAGYSITRLSKTKPVKNPPFVLLWQRLSLEQRVHIAPYLAYSRSQFAQDLFVISRTLHRDIAPFFVEFGAANGIDLSNTYLLEKHCGWQGILAEPARIYHDALQRDRTCCIDLRCVAEKTGGSVDFLECPMPEFSSMAAFSDKHHDVLKSTQADAARYPVATVNLNDLLEQYSAPRRIGYLSIDTEGSELAILQTFDFHRHSFDVITVEHNHRPKDRAAMHRILTSHGYERVYDHISRVDDWYVRDASG